VTPLHYFFYRISGLTVQSDFELPGALPADAATADVVVRQCDVPARLEALTGAGPDWQMDDSRFLLSLPGIGRFLVADGRLIEMQPEGEPRDAVPFLLGTALGALLLQRGNLVLHASSVSRDGGGVALCGHSGIGKSTLAAALCRAGCNFVSDDVSVVELGPHGVALWPDGRCLKLFEESLARLGLAAHRGQEVGSGTNKHYVELRGRESAGPMPLRAIYVLRDREGQGASQIVRLSPVDAAQTLLNESHRPLLSLAMAKRNPQVAMTAAVVAKVPMFRFARGRDLDGLHQTAEELLVHWRSL
jgi:hypothetical protein